MEEKVKKSVWQDIKWLLNYMASVFMYSIIAILLMIGVVLLLYYIDVMKNKNSTEWHAPLYGAYVIVSNSMETTIMTKDAIITKRIETEDLKVNDIVTYKSEDPYFYGIMITHRIIDIVEDENGNKLYVTKGDNNNTSDRLKVKPTQIYGKVVMVIPKIGYLQAFIATSIGWLVVIVIPCLGIIIYDVIKLIKNIQKRKRNEKRREGRRAE